MYAVNVCDLRKDDILATFLIAPVIKNRTQVIAEKGMVDGQAVLLDCDDERANAIVQIVRKKYPKNLFRFYTSKTMNSWKRL